MVPRSEGFWPEVPLVPLVPLNFATCGYARSLVQVTCTLSTLRHLVVVAPSVASGSSLLGSNENVNNNVCVEYM